LEKQQQPPLDHYTTGDSLRHSPLSQHRKDITCNIDEDDDDDEVEEKTSLLTTVNNTTKYRTKTKESTKMVTPAANGMSNTGTRTNSGTRRSHSSTSSQSFLITVRSIVVHAIDIVLRWIIFAPFRTIQQLLFPFNDNDETSPAVTAKLAQQFISYLKSLPPIPPSATTTTTTTTTTASSATTTTSQGDSSGNSNWLSIRDSRITEGWSRYGFEAARHEAIMNQSLLLVYIHSPLHRCADAVANNLLNSKQFLDFLNQPDRQLIAIGVSVHTTQGAKLANLLRISMFPALVVLQPEREPPSNQQQFSTSNDSNNENNAATRTSTSKIPLQLILRAESMYNLVPARIVPYLQSLLTRHQVIVAEREMKRMARQQEIELRKQQDEEYYATLLADQEREAQIERERLEKERIIQETMQAEQERVQELERKKHAIRPEPSTSSTGVTSIRLQFSNGCKVNRKFYNDDTIDTVRTYVQLLQEDNNDGQVQVPVKNLSIPKIGTIGLSTTFPRKTFNDDEYNNQTLEELGLTPHAVLMVQDLDL
jgi:UBX domain